MDKLEAYDYELDPPTMLEFQLFLRLGNLFDILDGNPNWTPARVEEELCEIEDLLDTAGGKYDSMLMDWYRAQPEG